ncbi:enoyl-CoA hydratase/isomerase family protein [Aeromicrobium alkaliterrae]|uniref:Enoyl-CoA hydratase-related protein n=1 Tax=Aeromicrobium alkaliterrae TaxID=302168 RepID=A0ABP4WA86_9ACTN
MAGPAVTVEIVAGVGTLALNRPENGNAFDAELTDALGAAVAQLAETDGLRAVLVRAEGPSFSLGGDVRHFRTFDPAEYGEVFGDLTDRVTPALVGLLELPVPVVTAVHGWVVGAGLSLVGIADVVLAADDTRFRTAFTGLGLPGDTGVTWFLSRLVGPRRAASLLLENPSFSAREALEWGLVTRLVPADTLADEALALATRLGAGPTVAYAHALDLVASAHDHTLAEHLQRERASTVACAATDDLIHGIAAFAERRVPEFEGR